MLAARAEKWTREWWEQGNEEGLRRGLEDGLRRGLEDGLRRGLEDGRKEGRQEGRQAGEAALLLRLLERRFGVLPDAVKNRVLAAETAVLEEWSIRFLDAATLGDVFADPPVSSSAAWQP